MKIAIRQVRGGSGADVWAESLCRHIRNLGHDCNLELFPGIYQLIPPIAKFRQKTYAEIIHGNSWNAFVFKEDAPLVVTEHLVVHDPAFNVYRTLSQKLFHRWILHCEKKSLNIADAVVCVSQDTRKKMEETFEYPDAQVIYNGVDSDLFRPQIIDRPTWNIPDNITIVFFSGNLTRRKGADLLPLIMNELGDEFLLLTTSGIRNQSQNGIPHSRDLGHLNLKQLIDAYNLCDIFLIPSRLEGLSLSTLEAMACAKPIIAFNCSSFPELIVDGKGGFLPEKDNVKDLVERIRYLSKEPDLIRSMGIFNRDRVLQNFTVSRMANDYLKLYQSLLR